MARRAWAEFPPSLALWSGVLGLDVAQAALRWLCAGPVVPLRLKHQSKQLAYESSHSLVTTAPFPLKLLFGSNISGSFNCPFSQRFSSSFTSLLAPCFQLSVFLQVQTKDSRTPDGLNPSGLERGSNSPCLQHSGLLLDQLGAAEGWDRLARQIVSFK